MGHLLTAAAGVVSTVRKQGPRLGAVAFVARRAELVTSGGDVAGPPHVIFAFAFARRLVPRLGTELSSHLVVTRRAKHLGFEVAELVAHAGRFLEFEVARVLQHQLFQPLDFP